MTKPNDSEIYVFSIRKHPDQVGVIPATINQGFSIAQDAGLKNLRSILTSEWKKLKVPLSAPVSYKNYRFSIMITHI